jgi:hypothetical protein
MHTAVWQEILEESDHLDEIGVDGRKILILTSNTMRCEKWIYLAEARNKWRALLKHFNELPGSAMSVEGLCFSNLTGCNGGFYESATV